MGIKLSICIFAYYQAEQIKKQLDELITYEGYDIEVVISDDTTDDSVRTLVESYKDSRFRYVKNEMGAGADGNYLNAIKSAKSDYAWIFRSSDSAIVVSISQVIKLTEIYPDCSLYFPSSVSGSGLKERRYEDRICREVWHSGTLHPSGYIINKRFCDFNLYEEYIKKYFSDYTASNVAFNILQADLGLKGETCFSIVPAWRYAETVKRDDKAMNSPGGKNPFGLEFEYKRYALMLEYALKQKEDFAEKVIHFYAKQILHIFGKRNSSRAYLNHYGCEKVKFNPYIEKKIFVSESFDNLRKLGINTNRYKKQIKKEAFRYGVIKPTIYRIKNRYSEDFTK